MQTAKVIDVTIGTALGVTGAATALWLIFGWTFDHWATRT